MLLACGLLAITILVLLALNLSAIRSNEKAALYEQASRAADSLLAQKLYAVENDLPPGTRTSFWSATAATPWIGPATVQMGGVDYEFSLTADTVKDSSGTPVGTVAGESGNRLKKVDITLKWWGGQHQGYGRLELRSSRIVNENSP